MILQTRLEYRVTVVTTASVTTVTCGVEIKLPKVV